ncbi:Mariner Mos1 transposase [Eumeta japonica]|uniref:Mariner Mos1 transposase n=1 Tax=Eumeta variegata TaxID=151549 RepID=A0A4C1YMS3_EUMVA|nr:Mariner Mos1 transposase [Eumeta japonica]
MISPNHTILATQQILKEFGWKVLMHPPYSPDLAPSDCQLLRSLQNSLDQVTKLGSEDGIPWKSRDILKYYEHIVCLSSFKFLHLLIIISYAAELMTDAIALLNA